MDKTNITHKKHYKLICTPFDENLQNVYFENNLILLKLQVVQQQIFDRTIY